MLNHIVCRFSYDVCSLGRWVKVSSTPFTSQTRIIPALSSPLDTLLSKFVVPQKYQPHSKSTRSEDSPFFTVFSQVGEFLDVIMQLLLGDPSGPPGPFLAEPVSDQAAGDHRVRYLACESLFNVAKVANEELLPPLSPRWIS